MISLGIFPVRTRTAKLEGASCEPLWPQSESPDALRIVRLLLGDPALHTAFFDKVRALIVNKRSSTA